MVGDQQLDSDLENALREAVVNLGMEQNAGKAGLTPDQLRAGTAVQERLLNPGPLPDLVADFVNIGLALAFYMTALGFGMMIAQSVVQEKESRVVEILAAAIPIRALLWGKVVGNTVLALSQIVVIATASLIGLLVTDQADILKVIAPVAGWFVVFFVLGFIPGYVVSWILKQLGWLRIPREVELAGLDYFVHEATIRDDDEMREALAQEARISTPIVRGAGSRAPQPAE